MRAGAIDLADAGEPSATTDVVVVGLGAAGACAAIAAAEAGASVTVVERTAVGGGSSALSGGELYLGGGTALQQACGFEDSPEAMLAYLTEALGPHADTDKLGLYCEGSVDHFDWLVSCGMTFGEGLFDQPSWMPHTDDGLMWLGENAWPFTDLTTPAPRGHRPGVPYFAGQPMMDALIARVRELGVTITTDTVVEDLVVDDGRVVGVHARSFSDHTMVLARQGVVLTTGGFVDNEAMVADHAPSLLGHGHVSDGLDDGSGINMGVAAGGSVRRMAAVQTALTFVPVLASMGIVVDRHGHRFINEDVYPGLLSERAVHDDHLPVWTIVDERTWESLGEAARWGAQPSHVCADAAELEAELGMPPGSLTSTIANYNEHAVKGEDPHHHKGARWVRPLEGALAAVAPLSGMDESSSASGFTLGGLRTDVDGRVQDAAGDPVPGLWAAGRATSGIHGGGYVSGTSLGDATFFGRRAGRDAAARTRPTTERETRS